MSFLKSLFEVLTEPVSSDREVQSVYVVWNPNTKTPNVYKDKDSAHDCADLIGGQVYICPVIPSPPKAR